MRSSSRLDTLVQFGLSHYPVNRLWRVFPQRPGKVPGCCVLVVLHEQEGHPLLLTTQRGDQHVMMGLPTLIMRDAQAGGLHSRPLAEMSGDKMEVFHSLAGVTELTKVHSCRELQ